MPSHCWIFAVPDHQDLLLRAANSGTLAARRPRASRANGYQRVDEFYDAPVSGADPIADRNGFSAMLNRIVGTGVRTIIVEGPERFARDLAVQLAGHD